MAKHASNGVIPAVIEVPALKMNCANGADRFDCIKAGTITGANICHLALAVGTKRFASPIIMIANIIKGSPVNHILPTALAHQEAITVPIFVSLNTEVNCDTTKININISPIGANVSLQPLMISLSFLILLAPIP